MDTTRRRVAGFRHLVCACHHAPDNRGGIGVGGEIRQCQGACHRSTLGMPRRVAETGRRTYVDTLGAVCSVHVAPSQYLCSCSLFGSGYQAAGTDGGGTGGGGGEESG
jgi:hypothetical protein